MIVDDSLVIRNRIARLCTDGRIGGIEIVGLAANGHEALELARRTAPDCVTMDLTMPEMDGEACIAKLASLLPAARILVVSALSDKTTALRAIKRGAHGFVHKPFDDAQLISALEEMMK
ncbi:MAG: response regulator [Caenispirillum sp.]|nr:response regulator [Caenispirillum sp.]